MGQQQHRIGEGPDIAPDGAGGFSSHGPIAAARRGRTFIARASTAAEASTPDGFSVTGVAVGANTIGDKAVPKVKADGTGGAIVAGTQERRRRWMDSAQRLNGSGASAVAANGVAAYATAGETTNSISSGPGRHRGETPDFDRGDAHSEGAQHQAHERGAVQDAHDPERQQHGDDPGRRPDRRRRRRKRSSPSTRTQVRLCSGSLEAGAIASGWGRDRNEHVGGFTRPGGTRTALVADGAGGAIKTGSTTAEHHDDGNRSTGAAGRPRAAFVGSRPDPASAGYIVGPGDRRRERRAFSA